MSNNRLNRINEEIQRELSGLIRGIKDPRVDGVVSITAVETTGDLRYAKVYISVLNKENSAKVMSGLKSASGYLRRELGRAVNLRYTPELIFETDDSIGHGARIFDILKQVENKDKDL